MKLYLKFLPVILLIIFNHSFLKGQSKYYSKTVVDTLFINFENHYEISQILIIPGTETIQLGDSLLAKDDYNFSYEKASFSLAQNLPYSIFDTLIVIYQAVNLPLQKEYKRRSLAVRFDEDKQDTVLISESVSSGITTESIFGAGIEKSGTLVRGFTVGTTRDFSLSSGLRLQLSGKLSEDIEVVAALTDENTPIQPEGNTERLEELDKVFIQIKHPNATGTFGDYQLQRRTGEFGFIDRKLQGLMGEFHVDNYSGYLSVASSRGKFNTNFFTGLEGVQGPYRLTGINNERDIIVIAGTEKVFIDGIEMKRGENNDYVIEYSNAEITFTPNRLITSASRITVDFEYTDRRFSRNLFGGGAEGKFFDNALSIQFQYLREGDDQDAPIDISISDEDKIILSSAGDDRNKAVKSGVTIAPADSLGIIRGSYIQRDTLINGVSQNYYVYNPGDSTAIYNVSFSFMGEGKGEYIRENLGNFRFVGPGNGAYLPVIFLPLPELKEVGNLAVKVFPFEDFEINLEAAGSLWDRNRFSSVDDENNFGYARNIFLKLNPKKIEIGNINLGKIGFSYKDRFVEDKFTSPDRFNEIEFGRNYNIISTGENEDEKLREIGVNFIPVNELSISSTAGFLKRGESFSSNRYNNYLTFSDNKIYNLSYNLDYVESKNLSLKSYWLRQKGIAHYLIWKLKPGIEFLSEDRKDKNSITGELLTGSLRYNEINPFLSLIDLYGLNLSAKYSLRDEYFPVEGILQKESRAITQYYELNYRGIKEINSTLNFTYREKKYTPLFRERGLLNSETILIRSQSRFNLWEPVSGDLFYEVSTERSARLERFYLQVEPGTGNFRYIGDINNNGIQDENEFEPTIYDGEYILLTLPSDELFPVIDLRTNTKWRIELDKIFKEKNNIFSSFLGSLSTETLWRVEENSRQEDYSKIYLLKFSYFLNEQNTIRGSNYFQQDIFIFENQPDLNFRLRFTQRKSLNQFSGGTERGYNRERSLRITFRMVEEISNQTEITNETDNAVAPQAINRAREITTNSLSTDFSYRPERNIEVGFIIRVGRSEDLFPENPTIIDQNSQALRFNLSIAGKGRLRAEVERNELVSNGSENFLPFELTRGNFIGKNYFWRLNFDYRIMANLQSTLSYDGRLQGQNRVVHTARAEVRAFF